ncbi:hypothetical protein E2F46_12995 [Luteimonas aestuarii]|uniref:Uncharacterized protein n=1 Tax=Luteimonas aestuarii TaxID=453837 RepID=A0A4R5TJZ2_9GAMM|nr:hypothetical protein [Luteimonas aestuarii]TDK22678.1 hypothetical protein E2F46_12995 [Luteimonas aestuarii]
MKMTSQDYAELAGHSYDRAGNMHDLKDQQIVLEGVTYKVLEHADNPRTGYQGTIYQRMDSGEIIVAHRGTEFERERWKDLAVTDGLMVAGRTNPQAADAIALTERAREIAQEQAGRRGFTPEVTVTGHSLGGTLAQISAHYYDLRGETFNAYGAVSLNYRVPEGGNRVLNHVTAADMVSSASAHYGQVRVYAMPQEIEMLRDKGYANNDSRLFDLRNEPGAAIAGLNSHDMHYFRNVDGDGRADRSVLSGPRTRELAREYAPMIGKYREDVEEMRRGLTMGFRGSAGLVRDGIEHLRGPLESGEPVAREERAREAQESRRRVETPSRLISEFGERVERDLHRTLYGENLAQVPLRAPVEPEPSRAHLGPMVGVEAAKSSYVEQLLQAARNNDPAALRAATQGLQQSVFGQDWQQQVAGYRRELDQAAQASSIVEQAERQRQAQPAGLAR